MTIVLTEQAARHVKAYASKAGVSGHTLRLGVRSSGCSGLAYTVDYDSEPKDGDQVFQQHGVQVLVDRKSLPFLQGMEVDFVREGLNQRLAFRNPNVKDSCGCGESFSV